MKPAGADPARGTGLAAAHAPATCGSGNEVRIMSEKILPIAEAEALAHILRNVENLCERFAQGVHPVSAEDTAAWIATHCKKVREAIDTAITIAQRS